MLVVVEWELTNNDLFETSNGMADGWWVFRQVLGLPMGGHLSAALVELVALHREYTRPWPQCLSGVTTSRYRDNFFAMLQLPAVEADLLALAEDLTLLLGMPSPGATCR